MTTPVRFLFAILCVMTCWRWPVLSAAEPRADSRLRITLRTEVEITDRLVTIADVAQIAGGNPLLRERAGRLDLLKLADDKETAQVSRILVQARLLLSDAAPDGFRVDGAAVTRVVAPVTSTPEDRALAAARTAISRHLLLAPDEVVVQLSQPLSLNVLQAIERTPAHQLEARLSTSPTGGNTRIELWIRNSQGVQHTFPIAVDLRFRQIVPVVQRPVRARQSLTSDDVALEPRELPQRSGALTLEQVIGMSLRRTVVAGEVIKFADLIAPVADDEPVLVKARDVVKVVVKKGALTLTMPAAEALQAGREGETIRIRNTRSGRVVIGRVTGKGEVEVPL